MTRTETFDTLKAILAQQGGTVDVSAVTEDTAIDGIGLDSIAILDFIYDVEDRFQIRTEVADLVGLERVRDLVDYVEGRRAG